MNRLRNAIKGFRLGWKGEIDQTHIKLTDMARKYWESEMDAPYLGIYVTDYGDMHIYALDFDDMKYVRSLGKEIK